MLQSDNIIDEITEQSFNEIEYDTIEKLNKGINKYDWIIVYVNIRRLNSNVENLEALLRTFDEGKFPSLNFGSVYVLCACVERKISRLHLIYRYKIMKKTG